MVTSNGELLYKTLWETAPSEVLSFWERINFPLKYLNWFWDPIWGLEIKHLKAHNLCDKGVFFSSIILSELQRPIELKCSQVCYYLCTMLRYTKWEDWSLTIITKVSSASIFKTTFWFFYLKDWVPLSSVFQVFRSTILQVKKLERYQENERDE